jgi:hypothetical protein
MHCHLTPHLGRQFVVRVDFMLEPFEEGLCSPRRAGTTI